MITPEAAALAAEIRAHLALQPGERLYTVIDACQDADLAPLAASSFGQRTRMLFQGDAAHCMQEVAPYFIPIDPETDFLAHWAARWGKNVGIFLISPAEPQKVFRHLRHIFVVKDEEDQEFFFRFYDPRVLRVYLPTCTPEDAREFFGPISAMLAEGDEGETLMRFTPVKGAPVQVTESPLAATSPPPP